MASPVDLGSPALRSGAAASHYQAGPRTEDGGRARVFHCGKVPSPLPSRSLAASQRTVGGLALSLARPTERPLSVERAERAEPERTPPPSKERKWNRSLFTLFCCNGAQSAVRSRTRTVSERPTPFRIDGPRRPPLRPL